MERAHYNELKTDLSSSAEEELLSDEAVKQMFTSADRKILEELKVVSSSSSLLPPASLLPSPRQLTSKVDVVVAEGDEQSTDVPELTSTDFEDVLAFV
jgi:hypothetical protein